MSKQIDSTLFCPRYFRIGLVPILIWPQAVIDLNASGGVQALLHAPFSQSRSFTYGVAYSTSNGFSAFADVSPNQVSHTLRLSGNAGLMLSATAGLNFLIDGVAGPGVSAGPYVGWSADTTQNPWWKLSAGIEASVNFAVNPVNVSYSHTFATIGSGAGHRRRPVRDRDGLPEDRHREAQPDAAVRRQHHGCRPRTRPGARTGARSVPAACTRRRRRPAPTTSPPPARTSPAANDTATVTVPPDPPTAPTGVSAVPAPSGATVSWSAPGDDGGVGISSYTVTASPGGAQVTTNSRSSTAPRSPASTPDRATRSR